MFKFVTECWYWKLSNYFNFWDKCKHDQISDQIRISKYQSADIGQLYLKRIHMGKEEKRKRGKEEKRKRGKENTQG